MARVLIVARKYGLTSEAWQVIHVRNFGVISSSLLNIVGRVDGPVACRKLIPTEASQLTEASSED